MAHRRTTASHMLPNSDFWEAIPQEIPAKLLYSLGERAGTRTQDPLIKSQMLYRLSYALPSGVGLH